MKNRRMSLFIAALLGIFLSSCAYLSSPPEPEFTAIDLNAKLTSGEYQSKVDNFLLIQDASSSLFMNYNGEMKFKQSKRTANNLNATIPDLDMQAGIRIFGPIDIAYESKLQHGMTDYNEAAFADTLATVSSPAGGTPLSKALRVAKTNLADTKGSIALILISDAEDIGKTSVKAATMLKETYGDRICIYTILIGDNSRGRITMDNIAKASGCGFATDYASLESPQGMADFVERVFLERAANLDSDGDGVYDRSDKCPGTPKGTKVDATGCPIPQVELDSDGDGVYDSKDQCPGTPMGIKVDQFGCPLPIKESVTIELRVEFDFDKDAVRPQYRQVLQNFANFMTERPGLSVTLEGHTDNYGTESYNADLSNRRANNVKQYLTSQFGLNANRIMTKGYGYSRPDASNDTREGRQRNRRVFATISAK